MKKALIIQNLLVLSVSILHASSSVVNDGVEAWFKTVPVGINLQGSYRWLDVAGDSVTVYDQSSQSVKFPFTQDRRFVKYLNFNPAIDFSKGNSPKWSDLLRSSLVQSTIIGVFAPYSFSNESVLYGIASGDGSGSLVTTDKVIRSEPSQPLDYGDTAGEDLRHTEKDSVSLDLFKEHATKVMTYYHAAAPNTSVWGGPNGTLAVGGKYSASDRHFSGTFDTSEFNNKVFEGYIPELIVYNRMLTPGERRRAESYLAMKYGITLKDSYLDWDGNLAWDMDEAGAYHNRVTSVARNSTWNFIQPVSATSYEEGPLYASLPENDSYYNADAYGLPSEEHLLVMGREYGNIMPDKGFLFWGDDGGSLETYTSPNDSLWHIMNRTWLVKTNMPVTGDTATVRWTGDGMTVISKGFLDMISQNTGTAGKAVTPNMVDNNGFIEFSCPTVHPTFDVGFSSSGDVGCS